MPARRGGKPRYHPALKWVVITVVLAASVFGVMYHFLYPTAMLHQIDADRREMLTRMGLDPDTGGPRLVTLDQFVRIRPGMTYQQVTDILGSSGELFYEIDYPGRYHSQLYSWWGYGDVGANMNVDFHNGRVIGKSQLGLR